MSCCVTVVIELTRTLSPEDLIDKPPWDVTVLGYWLTRYVHVCESRSTPGDKYLATTLLSLLSALHRRMKAISPDCPNFQDPTDPRFKKMHSIIDSYCRQLRTEGIGAEVKHTCTITKEEGNVLWEKGVMYGK